MSRVYVTVEFAVDAESTKSAELLVARRVQDFLGTVVSVCTACGTRSESAGGAPSARVFIEAQQTTTEAMLQNRPAMLTEELGYVEVEGGKPIAGDGRG